MGWPARKATRDAERRHLGERQVHEDDAAGQHVQPEVDVDAGEDQAGQERQPEEARASRAQRAASASARRRTLRSKSAR